MQNSLSIFRRGCANVIDYIMTVITSAVLFTMFAIVFGPCVTNSGYYFGTVTLKHSYIYESSFFNHAGISQGEIWTIIIVVLASALSQYLGELRFSSTIGVKIMGGICISNEEPITHSEALVRFFARICYYPAIFIFMTHVVDFSPLSAIASMLFISFVSLLKSNRNIIEVFTGTDTVKKI